MGTATHHCVHNYCHPCCVEVDRPPTHIVYKHCIIPGCQDVALVCSNHAPLQIQPAVTILPQIVHQNVIKQHEDIIRVDSTESQESSHNVKRMKTDSHGCVEKECKKRRVMNSEKCVEHSRPETCIVSKCDSQTTPGAGVCESHLKAKNSDKEKTCRSTKCSNSPEPDSSVCAAHITKKFCKEENCSNLAHGRGLCKGHGGTKKCAIAGCETGARGKSNLCMAHGGGQRCKAGDCSNGAVRKDGYCRKHGGGKRCAIEGCSHAASGKTELCKAHGGGKRCVAADCEKPAHNKDFCYKHYRLAGFVIIEPKECVEEGCRKKQYRSLELCKEHSLLKAKPS